MFNFAVLKVFLAAIIFIGAAVGKPTSFNELPEFNGRGSEGGHIQILTNAKDVKGAAGVLSQSEYGIMYEEKQPEISFEYVYPSEASTFNNNTITKIVIDILDIDYGVKLQCEYNMDAMSGKNPVNLRICAENTAMLNYRVTVFGF